MEIWKPERNRAVRLTGQKSPHFTRSGPGRVHNHSGTEKQFWRFSYPLGKFVRRFNPLVEHAIRERLNRFTKEFHRIWHQHVWITNRTELLRLRNEANG